MATLTVQEINEDGLNPSLASANAGGDEFPNSEDTFFAVDNGDASSHTVTFTAQRTSFDPGQGLGTVAFSNKDVTVPAGEQRWIKVPPAPFNDVNGRVQVTYDDVTSVTVAAVKL